MHTSSTGVSRTRQVVAAVIGNALEWYDFIVYGFLASIIARQFFPSEDEYASLLMALATFGVGFFMRPVGGILLGMYSDRKGRKAAMQMIIRLMTVSIALIAFAPNYAAIGMGAPLLIVVARMLQGFATGGEYASATAFLVESAPAHRKGLYGSWQLVGQCLAVFSGAGMVALFWENAHGGVARLGMLLGYGLLLLLLPIRLFIWQAGKRLAEPCKSLDWQALSDEQFGDAGWLARATFAVQHMGLVCVAFVFGWLMAVVVVIAMRFFQA